MQGVALLTASAAIVLVQFASVTLNQRVALVAQAVATLALVAALAGVAALARAGRSGPRIGREPLVLALSAWTAAAMLGTCVGLLSHNALSFVAGQALSMGLLPLGALVGLGLSSRESWRALARGIVLGAVIACALHLAVWLVATVRGITVYRLYLPNGVSVAGIAMLALVLALALVEAELGRRRAALGAAVALILLCIAGTGTRSLWLVTPVVLLVYAAFSGHLRRFLSPQALLAATLIAAVVVSGTVTAGRWIVHKAVASGFRTIVVTSVRELPTGLAYEDKGPAFVWSTKNQRGRFVLTEPNSIRAGRRAKLIAWTFISGASHAYVGLEWLDRAGASLGASETDLPSKAQGEFFTAVGTAPPGAEQFRVVAGNRREAAGVVQVMPRMLMDLGTHPVISAIAQQISVLHGLLATIPAAFDLKHPQEDMSISFRIVETKRLWALFVAADVPRKVFGHGLGGTFELGAIGKDNQGNVMVFERPNYIHNFYLFLLYKLGVVGTVLVLAALAAFFVIPARAALRMQRGARRSFLAAAAAAWLAYAIWSVACPEILDFHMAPLWGLLVAETIRLRQAQRQDAAPAPHSRQA